MHYFLYNFFGHSLFARQVCNGLDHFLVGFPLISQILSTRIINIVNLSYFVQSIDSWIASCQSFLEMCPGTHVLVTGPVKFYTRLAKKFLNIDSSTALPFSCSTFYGLTFSSRRPRHILIAFSVFCLLPNPPNRVKVLVVLLLSCVWFLFVSRERD